MEKCEKEDNWCQREKRGCTGCKFDEGVWEKIKCLEIHIANELDDEQWENWQEVLKYMNNQDKIIDLMSKELTNIIDATEEEIKESFRRKTNEND